MVISENFLALALREGPQISEDKNPHQLISEERVFSEVVGRQGCRKQAVKKVGAYKGEGKKALLSQGDEQSQNYMGEP